MKEGGCHGPDNADSTLLTCSIMAEPQLTFGVGELRRRQLFRG